MNEDGGDYEAEMFVLHHETRSHILQVNGKAKDGINGGQIPRSWVLLDSQSTADVYSNPNLLKDIRKVPGSLTIYTQTGTDVTRMKGTVPGYGEVWYHQKGIANILSLAKVAKTRVVKYNSQEGNRFEVTKNDGTLKMFMQSEHGLYYYDMAFDKNLGST